MYTLIMSLPSKSRNWPAPIVIVTVLNVQCVFAWVKKTTTTVNAVWSFNYTLSMMNKEYHWGHNKNVFAFIAIKNTQRLNNQVFTRISQHHSHNTVEVIKPCVSGTDAYVSSSKLARVSCCELKAIKLQTADRQIFEVNDRIYINKQTQT